MYQFECSFDTYAIVLLFGQRVICDFQLDSRANAVVAQMDVRFEVKRVGIYGQFRAKPSEERADVAPVRDIVVLLPNEKVVFLK